MWKSACVGVYQLLNWKMHGETLKKKIIKGTLHEDQYTFSIISRSVLLRMKNISDKSCRETLNTNSMINNVFPKIVPFMR